MPDLIPLPAAMTEEHLTALHHDLLARGGPDVSVDMALIKDIAVLCLQILICAVKEAKKTGNKFKLLSIPSPDLERMTSLALPPEIIAEG